MRVCHCSLAGKNAWGGCCQDPPPEYRLSGRTWTSNELGPLTGSWTLPTTHHPKIKRTPSGWWAVTGHLAGSRSWRTWEEARDYALAKPTLVLVGGKCPVARLGQVTACNCTGACQPQYKWVADGYLPL